MKPVMLQPPERPMECPNCDLKLLVKNSDGMQPVLHPCPGLKGFQAPMVPLGQKCKVEARVRGDYIGKEDISYDDEGRPIMAVETTREDGTDVAVFAPCVNVRSEY